MYKTLITLLIIFLNINSIALCQSQLNFTKDKRKTLSFKIGDHVGFAEKGFTFIKTGELQEIKDSAIIVNGKTIKIEDIRLIGHRKKGTTLIAIGTAVLAGGALGYLTLPEDNSTTEKTMGLAIAIPLFTIGQIVSWKNRLYNVGNKYKFEVLPELK